MRQEQVGELLLQALETELGGAQIYEAAVECAQDKGLREEFAKYLEQTRHHVEIMESLLDEFGLDPKDTSPGREVVHHLGASLLKAIRTAQAGGSAEAAQLVAAEVVTLAETKDHLNWELLGQVAKETKGEKGHALMAACKDVEPQEDEHLYHTTGWTRELWLKSLGLPAVLPPPEEQRDVKTAIGAARAKNARDELT
jgi:rubrerythrin